jgi:hypothetical protein
MGVAACAGITIALYRRTGGFDASRSPVDRFVVQQHQLAGLQGNHRVRLSLIVAELDFVDIGSPILHHGAHLTADQTLLREILDKRYDGMNINLLH